MGLTGFILRAAVQLKQVETSLVRVDTVRTADIDETMAVLNEHDRKYGYTVAWSDAMAQGGSLGRSVITSGDFAAVSDLPPARRSDPFAFNPGTRLGAPGIGAVTGGYKYLRSTNSPRWEGFWESMFLGAVENGPYPVDRLFDDGERWIF